MAIYLFPMHVHPEIPLGERQPPKLPERDPERQPRTPQPVAPTGGTHQGDAPLDEYGKKPTALPDNLHPNYFSPAGDTYVPPPTTELLPDGWCGVDQNGIGYEGVAPSYQATPEEPLPEAWIDNPYVALSAAIGATVTAIVLAWPTVIVAGGVLTFAGG